jgi:hypothetical protein
VYLWIWDVGRSYMYVKCLFNFFCKLNIRNAAIIFVSFRHTVPEKFKTMRTHTCGIFPEKYRTLILRAMVFWCVGCRYTVNIPHRVTVLCYVTSRDVIDI